MATSLNNLAALYQDQGRYAEAEPLYQRSLAIMEKALGPEHPDVAALLNNLAPMLSALGKREEALDIAREAVELRRALAASQYIPTVH